MTFGVDDEGGGGADALDAALALVTQGLARLADLELWQLSEAQLRQAAAGLDHAGLLAGAQQVRLLGEVDARGLPGLDGTGSLGGWLRSIVPTMRPAEAAGLGKRAERLYRSTLAPELAPTRVAVEAGRVRPCQERVISDAITALSPPSVPVDGDDAVDPDQVTAAQQMLVTAAARFPAGDLTRLAVAVRHHLDPAADDRLAKDEAAQQRQRTLTLATEASGMVFLHGSLTPECGAALRTAIDTWSAPAPAADGTPDPRTPGQRRHDALHHLADTALATGQVPTSHGSPAKIIVRVDATTLSAALDAPDGTITRTGLTPAELADGTPLSRQSLARLACTADLVPILIDELGNPLDVGRTHRLFTPKQHIALIERDRGCTWPGCTAPAAWTDAHHLTPWQHGGRTDLTNAALLCGRHHRHVHTTATTGRVIDGRVHWDIAPPPGQRGQPRGHLAHRPPAAAAHTTRTIDHLLRQWMAPRRQLTRRRE